MQRRSGDDGGLQLAVVLHREQRSEERHAADEVVGAVDRVDVPAGRGVSRLGAVLLADEPVVGPLRVDPASNRAFDRLIGFGHERPVRLRRDPEIAAEGRPRQLVRLVAGGLSERQPPIDLLRRRRRQTGAPFDAVSAGLVAQAAVPTGHARIRSFDGSQSGSRTASKPIHSPKTSISPRVPIGASGGR